MRLLYLANQRLPTEKAYGIQIASMCRAFARTGTDVELVAPSRRGLQGEDMLGFYGMEGEFRFTRIRTPEFYPSGPFVRPAFWVRQSISAVQLARYALRARADIVYCRDEGVAILTALTGRRVCLELHSFSPARKILYWKLRILGVRLVCITRALAERMKQAGFRPDRIFVAPDGVDVERFDTGLDKFEARRRRHLPADMPIALYAGHFYAWKGADVLAEAASRINGIVVLVGGTEADIARLRSKYGTTANLMLVGHRPYAEIPEWLRAADVLVLPNRSDFAISRFYTSPLKLFEYMASGVPIVASDLPSLREVVDDSNAVLVPPGDVQALADAVNSIFADLTEAAGRAAKARTDARQYAWLSRTRRIMAFLE